MLLERSRPTEPELPLQFHEPSLDADISVCRNTDGAGKRPHKVGTSNDADQHAVLDNRQSLDAVVLNEATGLSDRCNRGDGHGIAGHDLAHLSIVITGGFASQLSLPEQQLEPMRSFRPVV